MAKASIFVDKLYDGKKLESYTNAEAIGSQGADGARAMNHPDVYGMIPWFPTDNRIDCTNGSREMWVRVHAGLEAWRPRTDLGYDGKRPVPKQLIDTLGDIVKRAKW